MGRHRNDPQMIEKEEDSERVLNEIEGSQLPDSEFKALVIRKPNELTENYQKLQGNYNELTANYMNMKQEIEIIKKGQEEAEDRISELEDKVEKKHPERARKGKEAQKE